MHLEFLHTQAVEELTAYLCLTNRAPFGALGIELRRTITQAEGCEKCDLGFR
jgi:hypothetical protein